MLDLNQLSECEIKSVTGGNVLAFARKVFEAAGITATLSDVNAFIGSLGMPSGVPSGPSTNHITVRQWYSIRDK
ncbi:hypothetical protein [Alteromonas antoniana]|uniref:hypothetical protein n=1 Tax=Alteromonas antoniana TaxID=2803813 RepID=UPI001C46848E|nr:hypothetical protein [Alteromonas antoniana]